jgi:FPC/CPF motif-containing protein YcgG
MLALRDKLDETIFCSPSLNVVEEKLKNFILQKNYPCIGALQAIRKNELRVGVYKGFGSGESGSRLYDDLRQFQSEQKSSNSPYLTYCAVFPWEKSFDEGDFEKRLWEELTSVSSNDRSSWDPHFSDNPEDKKFCFSLGGEAFFVVGLHDQSSRQARRFEYPTLIFNLYEQFEIITRLGQYEQMVAINRKKDVQFQGNVNPMVEKHGDRWEAIQFSGKSNGDEWKCPFRRFFKKK